MEDSLLGLEPASAPAAAAVREVGLFQAHRVVDSKILMRVELEGWEICSGPFSALAALGGNADRSRGSRLKPNWRFHFGRLRWVARYRWK
jgi:hypothetical protein